jgi:hypothetical protein
MVAHDYSMSIYDCPGCRRLREVKHDLSKPPSECPGCVEAAAIRGGYAAHAVAAKGASAHHPSANHAPVTPATSANAAPHDLISARARDAAREAVQRMRREREAKRAAADSWAAVIDEINRNHSPGGR